MSVVIGYNPYIDIDWDNINFFKGNLHCHSVRDYDGHGNDEPHIIVEEYDNETSNYREHGKYHILALTEHDHRILETHVSYPWEEWSNRDTNYSDLITEVPYEDRNPEDVGLIAISGLEVGHPHQIQLFTDYIGAAQEGESVQHNDWYPSFRETVEDVVDDKNGYVFIAHPHGMDDDHLSVYQDYSSREVGLEIRNGSYPDVGLDEWDEVLTTIKSEWRHSKPITGFGNDDRHSMSRGFGRYNLILAEELKKDTIENSIRRGKMFVIENPNKINEPFEIDNIEITRNQITINIDGDYDKVEYFSEGKLVSEGNFVNVETVAKKYIRGVVTKNDFKLYTQPFGLISRSWK